MLRFIASVQLNLDLYRTRNGLILKLFMEMDFCRDLIYAMMSAIWEFHKSFGADIDRPSSSNCYYYFAKRFPMAPNTENRRAQHIQRGYYSRSTAIISHTVASAWQPRQSAPTFIHFERLLLLATLQHMLWFASAHRIELDW